VESVTPGEPTRFSLHGRAGVISLESTGLHHPTGARFGGPVFTAYADITHLATSSRAIWLGTRQSVYVIARRTFVDPHGPEHLVRALLEQISRQPGGSAQLARMAQIEETSRTHHPLRATWGLAIACVVAYVLQVFGGPEIETVGSFISGLATDGDWWRLVTANLLHANIWHLSLNVLGLLAVGALIERPLGTAATVCIMAASGFGAMAASTLASPTLVVGVSGVLSGMLAALFWLEFRFAESLPSWWRVPRRGLLWLFAINALLSLLPFIATAAHAGGFVAGGVAAACVARRGLPHRASPRWMRAAATASVLVCLAAVGAAAHELLYDGNYNTRFLARLVQLPGTDPEALNLVAWEIAVDPKSTPEMLGMALELAQRAVDDTSRSKAHILDTLAEVHFQLGHREAAVSAIDEAILRDPDKDYYREQRRRFLGERDRDDRPELAPEEQQEPAPQVQEEEGLSV
jgi:membrane associated rhomboid family serine protease